MKGPLFLMQMHRITQDTCSL